MTRNLKPERNFHPADSDISFFCYTPVEEGKIVVIKKWPTGGNLDDPNAEVGPVTAVTDTPAGVMVQQVVAAPAPGYVRDMSDFEVIEVGSKVCVYKHGWFVTRCIDAAAKADAALGGKAAYFNAQGYFTTTTGSARVGTFQSAADADGYARVFIDIPAFGR
jgi:hypothetical protein